MKTLNIGDISINKVLDGVERFPAVNAFPDIDIEIFNQHKSWMHSFYDFNSQMLILSMHSYLIQTPSLNILIDTCIGNDKNRVGQGPIYKTNEGILSHWNNRSSNYLENLEAYELTLEDIDIVMCTHMHADHVGWNTRLVDDRWVPTFPNAKYLFSPLELDTLQKESPNPFDQYLRLVYDDSVLPIIQSGQAEMIEESTDLGRNINLIKSPGHSPGHYCLEVNSKKGNAMLTGDILHNPIQVTCPSMSTMFCDDPQQSNQTRIKLVDELTDSNTIVLAAHFADTSAGVIESTNDSRMFKLI